ncbi:MAG: hypothetical protein Q8P28_02545 [Deltaproteobacteria bacterium]|nr:hypothetical protein [Deltaproteobacteria bacterium]
MLNKVKDCFRKGKVFYTFHAKEEMRNERFGIIKDAEVYEAVLRGGENEVRYL